MIRKGVQGEAKTQRPVSTVNDFIRLEGFTTKVLEHRSIQVHLPGRYRFLDAVRTLDPRRFIIFDESVSAAAPPRPPRGAGLSHAAGGPGREAARRGGAAWPQPCHWDVDAEAACLILDLGVDAVTQ